MTDFASILFRKAASLAEEGKATSLSLTYSPMLRTWTVEAWSQLSDTVTAEDGGRVRLTKTYLETPADEATLEAALWAFCRFAQTGGKDDGE